MTGFVLKLVPDDEMRAVLGDIITRLARIEGKIMTELDAIQTLTAKIAEQGTVVESVVTLLNGLTDQIKNAKDVSPEIMALVAEIDAQTAALSAAVLANTPQPGPSPTA